MRLNWLGAALLPATGCLKNTLLGPGTFAERASSQTSAKVAPSLTEHCLPACSRTGVHPRSRARWSFSVSLALSRITGRRRPARRSADCMWDQSISKAADCPFPGIQLLCKVPILRQIPRMRQATYPQASPSSSQGPRTNIRQNGPSNVQPFRCTTRILDRRPGRSGSGRPGQRPTLAPTAILECWRKRRKH